MSEKRGAKKAQIVDFRPRTRKHKADGEGGGGDDIIGGAGGDRPPRPIVRIVNGWRSQALDEAEKHLVKLDAGLFQRGEDQVVRIAVQHIDIDGEPVDTLRIIPVGVEHMRERFTRVVDLRRFDKRAKKWVSCDCPKDFAAAYLERIGWWRSPPLSALTTAPTLRRDGSILDAPGYDRKTRIYYHPRGVKFPRVPRMPTRADALAALDRIKSSLLPTIDLVDDAARSVALSGMFTALLRNSMSAAPLHAFTAPVPGAGKSKLVNLAAILRLGHPAPATSLGGRDEEAEKRLGTALIAGDPVISLDNIDRPLGGEMLDQLVTEPFINVRVLGQSLNMRVPNVYCLFATGNNLRVSGDMVRRTLVGRLDPRCDRPELREFETPDPVVTVSADRPALVIAVLTVARAFFLAGCPNEVPPLGSFADWSRWVRDPLLWLGQADPVETMEVARRDNPQINNLAAVLQQWQEVIGGAEVTVREVIERANELISMTEKPRFGEFREALSAVAGGQGGLNTQRLGHWLARVKGRVIDGLSIEQASILHGIMRWKVVGVPTG